MGMLKDDEYFLYSTIKNLTASQKEKILFQFVECEAKTDWEPSHLWAVAEEILGTIFQYNCYTMILFIHTVIS